MGNDKNQICKSGFLDTNGNETDIGTDILFVRIAYSQIGYKEKKSKTYTDKNGNKVNALPKCTSDVDGSAASGGWQKYSNSNINTFGIWFRKKF